VDQINARITRSSSTSLSNPTDHPAHPITTPNLTTPHRPTDQPSPITTTPNPTDQPINQSHTHAGGLAEDCTEEMLHAAFIPFGDIVEVTIPKDFKESESHASVRPVPPLIQRQNGHGTFVCLCVCRARVWLNESVWDFEEEEMHGRPC
jgi:hypothetical protein